MRTLFALLLAANLAFFAYTELDRLSEGESARLQHQLAPERIKLLSPQQVAALGPAKAAQLANVCLEWGGFTDPEKGAALAALEPLQLGKQLSQRRIESTSAYWVYVPPLPSKAAAERKVAELRNQGLKDFFILNDGPQKNAISLGDRGHGEQIPRNREVTRRQDREVRRADSDHPADAVCNARPATGASRAGAVAESGVRRQ